MLRFAFLIGTAYLLIGGACFAAAASSEDRFCSGASFSDTPALNVGRIKADAGKVNFRKNGDATNACPSTAADCQEKAYLVPGDLVFAGVTKGDSSASITKPPRAAAAAGSPPRPSSRPRP
jgi:hypothetical protein